MNSFFRCITAVIVCFCSIVVLTGCGNSEEELLYEEFLTVDVYAPEADGTGIQTGWYAELLKEKFNMQFNYCDSPDGCDLIICNGEDGTLGELIAAGALCDISTLLAGKEVMTFRDAIGQLNDSVGEAGIYAVPGKLSRLAEETPEEEYEPGYGPYVRWDVYEEIGYPEMNDPASLLRVLKRLQEACPAAENGNKTYALSFSRTDGDSILDRAISLEGLYDNNFFADKDLLAEDSWYISVLRFLNEAYREGLVDPDSAAQDRNALIQKYKQGEILFSFEPSVALPAYNTQENMDAGKGFMLAPVKNLKIFSAGVNPYGDYTAVIAVGSTAKDPVRMVDFIDWLYSPEGIMSSCTQTIKAAGPQGLTWEVKDGIPVLTDFGWQAMAEEDPPVPEEWGQGTWAEGVCRLNYYPVVTVEVSPSGYTYNYTLWDSYREGKSTLLEKNWQAHMGGALTSLEYLQKRKLLVVESIAAITRQETIVDYSWKMIYAEDEGEFEAIYERLSETME